MYGNVQELLALSYDDLPYYLKPCFLYLSVFPEDCQIPVGMLTRMWVAEGLVSAHKDMAPEDVAMQRLEELSHRFMIQPVKINFNGVIKAIHMHDLICCVNFVLKWLKNRVFSKFILRFNPLDNHKGLRSGVANDSRRVALHSRYSNALLHYLIISILE